MHFLRAAAPLSGENMVVFTQPMTAKDDSKAINTNGLTAVKRLHVQCPLPVTGFVGWFVCQSMHTGNRHAASQKTHTYSHTVPSAELSVFIDLKFCVFKQVANRCVLTGVALSAVHSL